MGDSAHQQQHDSTRRRRRPPFPTASVSLSPSGGTTSPIWIMGLDAGLRVRGGFVFSVARANKKQNAARSGAARTARSNAARALLKKPRSTQPQEPQPSPHLTVPLIQKPRHDARGKAQQHCDEQQGWGRCAPSHDATAVPQRLARRGQHYMMASTTCI